MAYKTIYKLGKEIAHGVRYFGQDLKDKYGNRTAMCICPKCGEQWRVPIAKVKNGSSTSCCGRGFKKKENTKASIDKEAVKIRYNGHNFESLKSIFPNLVEAIDADDVKYLVVPSLIVNSTVRVGEYIYYSIRNGVYTKND